MTKRWIPLFMTVTLTIMLACGRAPEQPAGAVEVSNRTDAAKAHGDHNPKYGGVVLMHGDLHFEVVLDPIGRHRVYFSDAFREELPASTVSGVRVTLQRTNEAPEPLTLQIDEHGESWIASGGGVDDPETVARVEFTYQGAPYSIEVPFTPTAPDPAAPDPHQQHSTPPPSQ
jgi:hypothetical protein